MQDAFAGPDEFRLPSCRLSLTKHFRGLRLWLPLKLHGVAPFRACPSRKSCSWQSIFIGKFRSSDLFPISNLSFSVVTYRYVPESGDADEFNKKLLEAVVKDGRVFISSTVLNGRYALEIRPAWHLGHISKKVDTLLDVLKSRNCGALKHLEVVNHEDEAHCFGFMSCAFSCR